MSDQNKTDSIQTKQRLIDKLFLPVMYTAICGPFILLLLFVFFILPHEQYYIFDPWIDTVRAPNYSEERFEQVQPGLSKEEVLSMLGEPLYKDSSRLWDNYSRFRLPEGAIETWLYTSDGAYPRGDYAWMGRYIHFNSEGKVNGKNKLVHYD